MVVSVRSLLALALVTWALVACGEPPGADPDPSSEVSVAEGEVRLVEEEEADLMLYVSNQSFDDEEVRLTVAVDGVTVVDGNFHVENQHNWVSFPLGLSPGVHEITAESETGATLSESFRVRRDRTGYAVIDHWGDDESGELTWLFQWQPIGFA